MNNEQWTMDKKIANNDSTMKKPFKLLMLFLLLISCFSCHQNRLKINEKELANEIRVQDNEKSEAEKIAREEIKPDTLKRLPAGFRYKEDRSVDPKQPPTRIDILGTVTNKVEFKLSDVATSIRYIKLQPPPDTTLLYDPFLYRNDLMSTITSDGEQIIFQGLFGLTRFNMQGEYQETVWENKSGIVFYPGGGISYGGMDFFGIMSVSLVSQSDGNIYFDFSDGPGKNELVMKYKPVANKQISIQSGTEIKRQSSAPGDTLINIHKTVFERFERIFGIGSGLWAGVNNKWNAGKSGALLVTYNKRGDTLCQFTDYDRIVNFSKANYRHSADLESYYYNQILTIKQEYNDTLFRLIPPSRLLPVYVFDFGNHKVNYMDRLNPDYDLSAKYILYSLFETNDYLFIRYTQNYDCPTNRRNKSVKFFNAFFNKKENKFYHQPGFKDSPEGLKNDIDGGLPFWPEFVTPQGEMMKLVSDRIIKDYLNSEEFKTKVISEANRNKQESLASGLKDRDMVVIIVK